MKKDTRLYIFIFLSFLWVVFIFARSLKSADESTIESAWVLDLVRKVFPSITMHAVRKMAHFTEFFILGALLFLAWRRAGKGRIILSAGLCLAAAIADELLQTLSPGRSCQISDILLDFCGSLAGIAVVFACRRICDIITDNNKTI